MNVSLNIQEILGNQYQNSTHQHININTLISKSKYCSCQCLVTVGKQHTSFLLCGARCLWSHQPYNTHQEKHDSSDKTHNRNYSPTALHFTQEKPCLNPGIPKRPPSSLMTWQKLTVSSVINEKLGDVKESPRPKKWKGIVYFLYCDEIFDYSLRTISHNVL